MENYLLFLDDNKSKMRKINDCILVFTSLNYCVINFFDFINFCVNKLTNNLLDQTFGIPHTFKIF